MPALAATTGMPGSSRARSSRSAIGDRQMFAVQTNSTKNDIRQLSQTTSRRRGARADPTYDEAVRRRIETIVVIVAAVCVFAAAIYVFVHQDPVPQAGQTPGFSTTEGATTTPTSTAPGAPKVVAFLGDEYTAGTGASDRMHGFSTLVSRRLGVTERDFGVTSGGYAKHSGDGTVYADRVGKIVAARPDVVLVTGGRNDTIDNSATLTKAAADLFATLHKKLPKATLVAVAPFWGDSDQPPSLAAVAQAVKAGVEAAGGRYLDIADPLHGHPEWMADGADPNDRGYAAIATALAAKLGPLIPRP